MKRFSQSLISRLPLLGVAARIRSRCSIGHVAALKGSAQPWYMSNLLPRFAYELRSGFMASISAPALASKSSTSEPQLNVEAS
jgi:hypothetical protein